MKNSQKIPYKGLFVAVAIIVGTFFFFEGIIAARSFLSPLFIAAVLALIIYPLSRLLEKWGLSRTLSALISDLLLFIISAAIVMIVSSQFFSFAEEWPLIKENMGPKIMELQDFIVDTTPFSEDDLDKYTGKSMSDVIMSINNPGSRAWGILSSTGSFIASYLLTFVYIFFMLRYRRRFVLFFISLLPNRHSHEVKSAAYEISGSISGYLVGQLILMGSLFLAYCVGLGISGVNNFILISMVATLLTLIPYLGNVVGFFLAFAFGYLTSGDIGVLIGVILTFTISQFFETYVLQPYVMGERVNLHPFFVLVMVIMGGSVWGLVGMVLAVPMSAVITTLLMHIKSLRVFSIALQNRPIDEESS